MNFRLIAALCMGALALPAQAADLPVKAGFVAPPLSWAGSYVGVHGGWGWHQTYFDDPSFNSTFNPLVTYGNGPLLGGQIGVNWQHGNFVYGVELDGSWSKVRGNTAQTTQTYIFSTTFNQNDFRALATGTARAGYAAGPWLFYAKAGGAYANLSIVTTFSPEPTEYIRNRFGPAAGAGVEVRLMRNVSAKVEYNFLYFPPEKLGYVSPNPTTSIDSVVQVMKFGINVYFGE